MGDKAGMILLLLVLLVIKAGEVALIYQFAAAKGRNPRRWSVGALFAFFPTLIILLILGDVDRGKAISLNLN